MSQVPLDPTQTFLAITELHMRTQSLFFALMNPLAETAARAELHRQYREAAAALLALQRRQNETGTAPSPWDLTLIAQPLNQQAMIEADLVDALGRPDEAKELREWALSLAETYLAGPEAISVGGPATTPSSARARSLRVQRRSLLWTHQ